MKLGAASKLKCQLKGPFCFYFVQVATVIHESVFNADRQKQFFGNWIPESSETGIMQISKLKDSEHLE